MPVNPDKIISQWSPRPDFQARTGTVNHSDEYYPETVEELTCWIKDNGFIEEAEVYRWIEPTVCLSICNEIAESMMPDISRRGFTAVEALAKFMVAEHNRENQISDANHGFTTDDTGNIRALASAIIKRSSLVMA